ncbi:MAG: hypothetical protein AB7I30_10160 [Isosphaeraceae bacterium]
MSENAVGGAAAASSPRFGTLGMALAAGLVAGLIAGMAGEGSHEAFAAPLDLRGSLEKSAALARAEAEASVKNAALAYGLLGAAVAAALGVAGGLARSSPLAAMRAGLTGLLVGAGLGAGAAWLIVPVASRNLILASDTMLIPLLIQVGTASAVGAAGGFAMATGRGGGARPAVLAILGGVAGAAVAAAGFALIGTLAFPLAQPEHLIPATRLARMLSRLAVAVGTALGAATGVGDRGRALNAAS